MNNSQPLEPLDGNHDPYSFILNPTKPKRALFGHGQSPKRRLVILGALAFGLLTIVALLYSLLSGGGSTTSLRHIALQQNEIIRVAGLAGNQARSATTLTFAQTTQYSAISSQKQLTDFLTKRGIKISPKEYQQATDSAIDKKLASAALTGEFDQTFTKQLTDMLKKYQAELDRAYQSTSNQQEKQLLKDLYDQIDALTNKPGQ